MEHRLILQLHVHSERSHDSSTPIKKYVKYLESKLRPNEYAILGITDHNVLPVKNKEAINLSTKKVLVIPGIEWKIHKTLQQSLRKLCVRREIITLGNHDNLENYIKNKTSYKILKNQEISEHLRENEFLDYILKKKNVCLIIPHPRHFGLEYYGTKEIRKLKRKIDNGRNSIPFFIEEKNGRDPLLRICKEYRKNYKILGGSDAHKILSVIGTNSLFSVETSLNCEPKFIAQWQKMILTKNTNLYNNIIKNIFHLLQKENKKIIIKKHYLRSTINFLGFADAFFKRRFENFPKNLFK